MLSEVAGISAASSSAVSWSTGSTKDRVPAGVFMGFAFLRCHASTIDSKLSASGFGGLRRTPGVQALVLNVDNVCYKC